MSERNVVIIGAGLSGLAAAVRSAIEGRTVTVLERNSTYGGKMSAFKWENYRWDNGPSLLTLPNQINELFELAGKKPEDYFQYATVRYSCHYYFNDGSNLALPTEPVKRDVALEDFFGQEEGSKAIKYIQAIQKLYNGIGNLFVDRPKFGIAAIFDPKLIRYYPKLMSKLVRKSLHNHNTNQFTDQRLVQLFDRFGTYNGSNPYQMSGIYSMVGSVELNDGVYFPKKGMRGIVDALYNLATELGVEFRFNERNIKAQSLAKGYEIVSEKGNIQAKNLISAIDVANFYKDILYDAKELQKARADERSSSGFVFYWAVEKVIPELKLHNIFFGDDYQQEFGNLFEGKFHDVKPTIYVHVSSVINPEDAPRNGQNWFVMINMPANYEIKDVEIKKLRNYVFEHVKRHLNVQIESFIKHEATWQTKDIETLTGAYQGAIYGASSNDKLSALKRHGNKSKQYKNLYFCGGTVHPGGGIPLVLKSAKIVANYISKNDPK